MEDEAIAGVPLIERQDVLTAQDEVAQAKADEVRYGQRGQHLKAEKARLQAALEAAQKKQASAQGESKVAAGRAVALAKARLDHLAARQAELDALRKTAAPRHRAAQAQYELAKARIVWKMGLPAKAKIADLQRFEQQAADTRKAYEASQVAVTTASDRVAVTAAAVEAAEQAQGPPPVQSQGAQPKGAPISGEGSP